MRYIFLLVVLAIGLGMAIHFQPPLAQRISSLQATSTPAVVSVHLVTPTPAPATPTPKPLVSIANLQTTAPVMTNGKLPISGPEDFWLPLGLTGLLSGGSSYYLLARRKLKKSLRSLTVV